MKTNGICIDRVDMPDVDRQRFIEDLQHGHPLAPPTCVPPPTVVRALLDEVVDGAQFVARMLFSLTDRIFDGDPIRQALELKTTPEVVDFIKRWNSPTYFLQAQSFFRPDLLLTHDGFKTVEINVGASLGGPGPCDVHSQAFQSLAPPEIDCLRNVRYESMGERWIQGIRWRLEAHTGLRVERPTFCSIVPNDTIDLRDDFTLTDLQTLMRQQGVNYVFGSLESLEFRPDGVALNGQKLDIVFTDFCYSKFLKAGGNFENLDKLMEAYERREILFLSPPHSLVYDQKLMLSFLSDPKYQAHFSAYEWRRLQRHVPFTTLLTQQVAHEIGADPDDWVLKPKFSFGGQGIVVGKGMDKADWADKLATIMIDGTAYVAQRFVHDQIRLFDPNLGHERLVVLGPLFNHGEYIGTLYRDVQFREGIARAINTATGARYGAIRIAGE